MARKYAAWDRSGDVHRRRFQQAIRKDLLDRGIGFTELHGTMDERLKIIVDVLSGEDP